MADSTTCSITFTAQAFKTGDRFLFTAIKCSNLPYEEDMFNSVDPYIKIKVAGNTTRKTKTIKDNLNPVFTSKNSFILTGKAGDWVECTVMDWDPISSDEVVIKGSVQLTDKILEGGQTTVPFQGEDQSGKFLFGLFDKDGWATKMVEALPGGGLVTSVFHARAGNTARATVATSSGLGTATSLLASKLSSLGDLKEVMEMVKDMTAEHREAWRKDPTRTSLLLLLGVLARHQAREQLATARKLEAGQSGAVEALCRKYWQHIHTVGLGLRRGVALASRQELTGRLERNRLEVAEKLGLPEEDLILVWVSECSEERGPEAHCPDLALSLDREQNCLVLTLLGTRIEPAPSVPDIVMDLRADSMDFLGGRAHKGMALGARNVMALVLDRLVEVLEGDATLSLLVTGYSLGAGMAQLVTASLLQGQEAARLPQGTKVRCIAFAAPPVYCGHLDSDFREVVVVRNNFDGIIGLSVNTITDLFSKVVAIDAAEIDPNTMIAMAVGEVIGSITGAVGVKEEDWERVRKAVEQRKREDSEDLRHLAGTVLQMSLSEGGGGVVVERYSGAEEAARLSGRLRLHPDMYTNHTIPSYSNLFQAVEGMEDLQLSCLDTL